ncbi:MAG: hypothetical protein J6B32_07875 [Spirochaetaceae bacterium]|nr:hypothetical protein [Spirochaetaceae bacterium]
MTDFQWQCFLQFRQELKEQCNKWQNLYGDTLIPLQKEASKKDTPDYPIETPVVYNTALDEITNQDEIKLIVIGDNPGKSEQLSINQKYLVGQSGKIAQGFFCKNPCLNIDFRKNTIILNKTPIHTAKTNHLKYLETNGSKEISTLIKESQEWMAKKTIQLHQNLAKDSPCSIWLVGYSQLKGKGLFEFYRNVFAKTYKTQNCKLWDKVLVFQHFSMNRFLIDLASFSKENPNISLKEQLIELGTKHRLEVFGE